MRAEGFANGTFHGQAHLFASYIAGQNSAVGPEKHYHWNTFEAIFFLRVPASTNKLRPLIFF